ncbi:Nuclear autoantigenic sperm protein [Tupaia chinensis]|uniref:Nuclear autoantigenic sperm protein n=1 Tax=Tupaia chinensis TaxID=246437 RepID=L9JAN8_TUPCH|nr:Nuclear autoantigenic sperm protein [Tupaia chinensis]
MELVSADKIEDVSAPATSADKMENVDVDSEAKKFLGLGQKHLVMGDIRAAVNAFQEAASLLGKKCGETANECGEAFFFNGKSLLVLASMENGVLENALEGSEEEDKENDKAENTLNNSTLENKPLQENEEEESGNLELAWDMLDLAKIIFKRQETKEAQLYAAQAHLTLGELGLAYGSQCDEAVAQFSKSTEVIEKRMAELNGQMKEAEGSPAEYERGIEELEELLPEIGGKIDDAKEAQHRGSSVSMIASRKSTDGASPSNYMADISHLVRKKRKPEEESPRNRDAKKAKHEPEVNGSSGDAVPSGNEVSENMEEEAKGHAESRATVEATGEAGATVENTAC